MNRKCPFCILISNRKCYLYLSTSMFTFFAAGQTESNCHITVGCLSLWWCSDIVFLLKVVTRDWNVSLHGHFVVCIFSISSTEQSVPHIFFRGVSAILYTFQTCRRVVMLVETVCVCVCDCLTESCLSVSLRMWTSNHSSAARSM